MDGKYDNSALMERINEALRAKGLKERGASIGAGLGPDGIRNIRRGFTPRADTLIKLAKHLQRDPAYFLEAMEVDLDKSPDLPVGYDTSISAGQLIEVGHSEYIAVARYDARISAGDGSILDPNAAPMDHHLFESQWLRSLTRAAPDHLAILRVDGDSMVSTLNDGDWVLVDRSQNRLGREGLYALAVSDAAWIKRLSLNLSERLVRIISDNPAYPMQELSAEELVVIGRAISVVNRPLR